MTGWSGCMDGWMDEPFWGSRGDTYSENSHGRRLKPSWFVFADVCPLPCRVQAMVAAAAAAVTAV